jgi:hypothetical protein
LTDALPYLFMIWSGYFNRLLGMTTREIPRELSRGMLYMNALRLAKRAAPLLDIGVLEFMRLRKNQ